jgi:hypothetical protein
VFDLSTIDNATLQQWNAAAINAFVTYNTTGRVTTANYTQGDGAKSVSYSVPDIGTLRAFMAQIQDEMMRRGLLARRRMRRAIGVRF